MGIKVEGVIKSCRRDRKGVQLTDGKWYSSRNKLAENLNRDTKVEFEFLTNESNGTVYNNIVDGTFKITEEAKFEQKGGYKSGGGFKKNDNFEAGVTAGAALNNAILLAAHGKIDMRDIKEKAIGIAKLSIDLKKEVAALLKPEAPKQEAPAQQPVQQTQPAPQNNQDDFDDDIPF